MGKKTTPAQNQNNAMVISPNDKQGIYFTHFTDDKIPAGSQPYYIESQGKWMHLLIEETAGVFKMYEPKDEITQYPEKLKRAVQMPANRAWWAMSKNPLEKLAMGAIIAVIAIGAILTFAMVSDKGKQPEQTYIPAQEASYDAGN